MRRVLLSIACLLLSACGSESQVSEQNEPQRTQLEETLSTQLDALEKARGVEQQVLDDAEKQKALIDAQGR